MAEQREEKQKKGNKQDAGNFRSLPKFLLWGIGIFFCFLLILFFLSFFFDEPLRKSVEKKMNSDLKGYSVKLNGMHLQLIGLSVTLKDLSVIQNAHPKPAVAKFPYIRASIHWREILSGKIVAKFKIDRPEIYLNLQQLRTEAKSKTPLKERGWQDAVENIYPFKINMLTVTDGDVVYIDEDPKRPLHLSRINLRAENIRNIRSPDRVYPCPFYLETVIFGTGRGIVEGKANFLAKPFPGINADFKFEKVPLRYFKPVLTRVNLSIENGEFFVAGKVEYAPNVKKAHVKKLNIKNLEINYIHTAGTAAAEKERAIKGKKAAGKVSNKPGILLRLDQFSLTGSTIGMINKSVSPSYRVFFADTDVHITNLSNHFEEGPAEARIRGKFMGSGDTTAVAYFRPEKKWPDFDINLKIVDTKLASMNNLLRAYGNFDVQAGFFSFYTEMHIKNNVVSGYVKPLFREIKVYDRRSEKEKSAFQKAYKMLVGGIAKLLENRPRKEVATKADISGPVTSPEASTLQIIGQLIRNAFFKAILPGFEQEIGR